MSFTSKAKAGPTPIISRCLPDGTLIETLYDAEATTTSLAVSSPDGQVAIVSHFDLPTGERLIPYAPTNNLIASGCVLLSSDPYTQLQSLSLLLMVYFIGLIYTRPIVQRDLYLAEVISVTSTYLVCQILLFAYATSSVANNTGVEVAIIVIHAFSLTPYAWLFWRATRRALTTTAEDSTADRHFSVAPPQKTKDRGFPRSCVPPIGIDQP